MTLHEVWGAIIDNKPIGPENFSNVIFVLTLILKAENYGKDDEELALRCLKILNSFDSKDVESDKVLHIIRLVTTKGHGALVEEVSKLVHFIDDRSEAQRLIVFATANNERAKIGVKC